MKTLQKELLKDVYPDDGNQAAGKDWWAGKSVNMGAPWNMHWLDKAPAKYGHMGKHWWLRAASTHWLGLVLVLKCPKGQEEEEPSINLDQRFQPSSSHGTHKLITKILWHTKKKYFFPDLTKS